jgi:cellulose synthase/poly-beta-1,6-N-acetylglucosamine synthase-like glycosyltransferase
MLVDWLLVGLSVPALAWTLYLAILSLLSAEVAAPPAADGARLPRFDVIVPAHDEEGGIADTVRSLLLVEYPADKRSVVVVADNCSDATAARAREAGATVLERVDGERRGKGYALAHAFERTLAEGTADAVVVVDADSTASPNLLSAFAARLAAGAGAVQAEYGVANARASWRTRLMHIAFTLFHDVRSRARERLGLSAGLRGNGMCFAVSVLREVPHDAFSVVEDVEYGIRLARAGHRVWYVGDAHVLGQMVSSEKASRSQRRRWEGGRLLLARTHARKLLSEGIRHGDRVRLDLAADLLVPPLTYVALVSGAGLAAALAWYLVGRGTWWAAAPWAVACAGLGVYILRGVWLSGVGPRAILDLMWAPVYMVWKVILSLRSPRSQNRQWVRTTRE